MTFRFSALRAAKSVSITLSCFRISSWYSTSLLDLMANSASSSVRNARASSTRSSKIPWFFGLPSSAAATYDLHLNEGLVRACNALLHLTDCGSGRGDQASSMGDAFFDDVGPDSYVTVVMETGSWFQEDAQGLGARLEDSEYAERSDLYTGGAIRAHRCRWLLTPVYRPALFLVNPRWRERCSTSAAPAVGGIRTTP